LGHCTHAGDDSKCEQRTNQGVFDKILTFLAAQQILELRIQLQK
jgi:hypothetical protein